MTTVTDFFGRRASARRRGVQRTGAVVLLFLAASVSAEPVSPEVRGIAFRYRTRVGQIEAGRGPVHVFVPLAREGDQQRLVSERVEASIPGRVEKEGLYGNRFWHGSLDAANGEPITVNVETIVERHVLHRNPPTSGSRGLADAERADLRRFLQANERVVVGHEVLDPILAEVRRSADTEDPLALARATYDWVVDNLEYKKVGTGWGNGDTFWACSERYGNCTDFHALFVSLARTQGIPARFEIGFPVPESRSEGVIGGYHCWVKFYLPETGWFPIDASEAFKHPEKRALFYGTHPADRIHFTTGRDLRLGDGHEDRPLNYFIYPHVEVGGATYDGPIENSFSYRDVPDRTARLR
jgi:transglutaminase-like putative cysteine protease